MNHSIHNADRTTHVKIVVLALVCATLVAGIGVAARVSGSDTSGSSQRLEAMIPLVKAGGPIAVTSSGTRVVR